MNISRNTGFVSIDIPIHVVSQEKPESSHVSSVLKQKPTAAVVKDPSSTKCHIHCCCEYKSPYNFGDFPIKFFQ